MKNISHEGQETYTETYSTCLYRFLGRCPNCIRDYNPQHFPNNYDCPNHKETSIKVFEVVEEFSENKLENLAN